MARLNVEGLRQFAEELGNQGKTNPVQDPKARSFSGVHPVGQLEEMLNYYGAPQEIQAVIARRAGGIIGPSGISHDLVERTIQDSMSVDGLPKWDNVAQRIGEAARDIYKGKNKRIG